MQIVQLEEQKLSWKDYWCFAKLIWENNTARLMFLFVFALSLEGIIQFNKDNMILSLGFFLGPAWVALQCIRVYLQSIRKIRVAEKEANRRIKEGQGEVITFEGEKCILSFKGNEKQDSRAYDELVVFELENYYYVNIPAIIKKDSPEGEEFRELVIEEDICYRSL